MFQLSDYNYTLPGDLIAQTPMDPPEKCKLLVYEREQDIIKDYIFSDIIQLIDPHSLIIFNNSKVLKARIPLPRIHGEIFYLSHNSPYCFNALVRPGRKFKINRTIYLNDHISFNIDKIIPEGRRITCSHHILSVLEKYGQMPLPPYINYHKNKESPYQPIFAKKEGSVASPTASLHFSESLLEKLKKTGIDIAYTTLHVGLGTFKQVDTQDITQYNIHSEIVETQGSLFTQIAEAKLANKKIIAVGTTVTRTLESLPYARKILQFQAPQQRKKINNVVVTYRDTYTKNITEKQAHKYVQNLMYIDKTDMFIFSSKLFIYPGFNYKILDQLITNFHLPKSTLLMLVAGLIGYEKMQQLYTYAIKQNYRFYSFGDAMWLK